MIPLDEVMRSFDRALCDVRRETDSKVTDAALIVLRASFALELAKYLSYIATLPRIRITNIPKTGVEL